MAAETGTAIKPGAVDGRMVGQQILRPAATAAGPLWVNGETSSAPRQARGKVRLPVSYRGLAAFVATLDILIILASAVISDFAYKNLLAHDAGANDPTRGMAASVFVSVLFVSATMLRNHYEPSRLTSWNDQLRYVVAAWCGTFLLLSSGIFASGVGRDVSRGATLMFWAIGGVSLLAHRAFWRSYLPVALASGALKGRNAIIVTWGDRVGPGFLASLAKHGYMVAAQLVVSGTQDQIASGVNNLINFARGGAIDDIFLVPDNRQSTDVREIVRALRVLPFPITLVPDEATTRILRSPSYELGPYIAVEVQRPPLSFEEQALKRTFDIVFASLVLVAILPLLAVVSLAIALDSPGPVLFLQTRLGFNGIPFKIFKFRTMTVLEDGDVVGQAKRGDKRVTRVGAWLRRTSIDELPQLLNVLRGEMSVVGPRPHALAHDKYFEQCVENYAFRQHVKSGITGWAQVKGSRGETDTLEKIQARVDLDLWYIRHWSFKLDLAILIRTIGVVVTGKDAF